jgi:hypothetical protein
VAVLTRRPAAPLPGGIRRLIGDLVGGQGLEMAVRGADVVVHLASRPFRPARVDVAGTRAGFRAGHHLAADTPRGERTWASYLEARLTADGGEVIGLPYTNKQVRIRLR